MAWKAAGKGQNESFLFVLGTYFKFNYTQMLEMFMAVKLDLNGR